jgi:hypothetical protein
VIPNRHDSANLEAEIADLRGLGLDGLRARWRTMFGRKAPAHVPRRLLLRILAYRVQADVLGDLDPATARYLDRLAMSDASTSTPLPSTAAAVQPGTVLMREWNGVNHRVMALDEGFAWEGTTYKSLSHVARAITGTRWSGPRFFGVREGAR